MITFSDRLWELINELTGGKHTVFAKKCGISPSVFHNYINGRMPSGDALVSICETFNINITWILTGKGPKYLADENHIDLEEKREATNNDIAAKHRELVDRFKNKALAKQITINLIKIEEVSPAALKSIADKIDGVLMGLQISEENKNTDDLKQVANGGKK